jgi:hypothetical protein
MRLLWLLHDCRHRKGWQISPLKEWLNARLQEMLELQMPDLLAHERETNGQPRAEQIRSEIEEVGTRARRLIEKQATSPVALSNIYDEELLTLGERLEILKANLREAEHRERQRNNISVKQAYAELATYERLEAFWQEPPTKINQLLFRLFGNIRLVVQDGKVVGSIKKPPHQRMSPEDCVAVTTTPSARTTASRQASSR